MILAAVAHLVFTTAAGSVGTGACSPPVTVQTQDAAGNPTPPDSQWTVLVSGASAFFPASGCSADPIDPQGDLQLSPGTPSATFRFIVPTSGSVRLSATAGTLNATQDWTVTPAPGEPAQVTFTTPAQTLAQSRCDGPVAFQLADVDGHAASADRVITVSFEPAYVEVYSDAACSQRLQFLALSQGSANHFTVFIKTDYLGQYQFHAGAPGLTQGSLPIVVNPAKGGGCSSGGGVGLTGLIVALDAACRRRRSRSACAS